MDVILDIYEKMHNYRKLVETTDPPPKKDVGCAISTTATSELAVTRIGEIRRYCQSLTIIAAVSVLPVPA